jgi:hypothetical protein
MAYTQRWVKFQSSDLQSLTKVWSWSDPDLILILSVHPTWSADWRNRWRDTRRDKWMGSWFSSCYLVPVVQLWLSWSGCCILILLILAILSIQVVMFCLSCSRHLVLSLMFLLPCSGCVLFCFSCFGHLLCMSVLTVIFWVSCSTSPFPALVF